MPNAETSARVSFLQEGRTPSTLLGAMKSLNFLFEMLLLCVWHCYVASNDDAVGESGVRESGQMKTIVDWGFGGAHFIMQIKLRALCFTQQ